VNGWAQGSTVGFLLAGELLPFGDYVNAPLSTFSDWSQANWQENNSNVSFQETGEWNLVVTACEQASCQVGPAIRMSYDVYFGARPQQRP
jgi:hypothetical protein